MSDPRPRPRLLEPSRIRPVAVDLRRAFWVGIGVWSVALVIALVGWRGETVTGRTVATCVAGILLGFAALLWERRRRSRGADPDQTGTTGRDA